ncbi:MAG: tetratricopeptide repeat protein, partial [Ignavibacteriae bacterium]
MNVRIRSFYFSLIAVVMLAASGSGQTIAEGEALVQKGKFSQARTIFEELIKKDGNNAEAHSTLGRILINRRNPDYDIDKAVDET